MGGARIRVRKGAGGEGGKERKEVAVAGGVMGGRIDEGSERLERGEGGIGVEVCGTRFTARNEQAENQLSYREERDPITHLLNTRLSSSNVLD